MQKPLLTKVKNMYAIIKSGSKQHKVKEGDKIDVELLSGLSIGSAVEFSDVLFVYDGGEHKVGKPSVEGFTVKGEVIAESAGPKIQSVKYKPRKRQTRKFGHRQHYHRVEIKEIAQG